MSEQEKVAGGPLGKVVGRAKQLAGAVLGRDDLDRERLAGEKRAATIRQRAAAETGAAKREAKELDHEADRAEEAAAAIDPQKGS